ncbi:MAG: hypothetical protein ACRDAI_03735 [Candidatus Rhabdochlamydia sp.]
MQQGFGLQHFGFSYCINLVGSQHPSVVQDGSLVGVQHPSVVQAGCLLGSQGLQQGLGHLGLQHLGLGQQGALGLGQHLGLQHFGLGQHLGLQHLGLGQHLGLQHLGLGQHTGLGLQQPSPLDISLLLKASSSALFLPQRLLLLSYLLSS